MTEKKNVIKKIMELSKRISGCDWTPDGGYTLKGRSIRYVTGQKIKRNVKPLLDELGLIFSLDIGDVQPLPACGVKENHALIKCVVRLTDADSGESQEYLVVSEGADAGDKAVLTGVSYAKRIFWIDNFDIIDGMEDEDTVSSNDVAANLLRSAIPEAAPETKPVAPKPASDLPRSIPVPSAAETISSPGEGNIAKMQVNAMNNALAAIKKADEEGRIMHEWYEKAVEIRKKASCKEDVEALLNIKRELGL